jgi:hypothetical protein
MSWLWVFLAWLCGLLLGAICTVILFLAGPFAVEKEPPDGDDDIPAPDWKKIHKQYREPRNQHSPDLEGGTEIPMQQFNDLMK